MQTYEHTQMLLANGRNILLGIIDQAWMGKASDHTCTRPNMPYQRDTCGMSHV